MGRLEWPERQGDKDQIHTEGIPDRDSSIALYVWSRLHIRAIVSFKIQLYFLLINPGKLYMNFNNFFKERRKKMGDRWII
jgi:hypothetical protein